MPEGHTIHRLARQIQDVFGGQRLKASSPQGRFSDGAARLNGSTLESTFAVGKQFFARFDNDLVLRVHLGLYGAWDFGGDESFRGASSIGAPRRVGEREGAALPERAYHGPPEPIGAVRLRLVSEHGWADLRGPSACEVLTEDAVQAQLLKLGPDPLGPDVKAGEQCFIASASKSRKPIGQLLMDQSVIAGVGNVYRADVLFLAGISPFRPGNELDVEELSQLWKLSVEHLSAGVRDGRIVTTDPEIWGASPGTLPSYDFPPRELAHWVYGRPGERCRACGTPITLAEMQARKLFYCPACQP